MKLAQYESAEADLKTAEELAEAPEMREFAEEETAKAKAELERLEEALRLELIPKDPNDERNIDILRMYLRYAESQGWKTEIVSRNESELGGYKEAIVRIIGRGAYSKLKFESGGHRVQRVPVTETQGRIHTSACTVAVLPELDEIEEVKLDPSELRIDVFRASGAGGQHIQKTDSAVRITHLPRIRRSPCRFSPPASMRPRSRRSMRRRRLNANPSSDQATGRSASAPTTIRRGE